VSSRYRVVAADALRVSAFPRICISVMPFEYDAVVVGSGPNGLTAAATLAGAGLSVLALEANPTIGGGCRSAELTLPGFVHDICAAIHPMGMLSPAFRRLRLDEFGLQWLTPPIALAHPLDDGTAAALMRSIDQTMDTLDTDGVEWQQLIERLANRASDLCDDLLRPVGIPRHPVLMARFAWLALRSCDQLVRSRLAGPRARALFAGCAAHSTLRLDAVGSASFGLVLAAAAHAVDWPCARGGSQRIVDALVARLRASGGEICVEREVRTIADIPPADAILFDVNPHQLERLAGDALPPRYRRRLRAFRFGPGVFKIDWALREPIPWKASACRQAGTVHVGGTYESIAESEAAANGGRVCDRPFVILAQQSLVDRSRAPGDHHTGWAYCHVPHASSIDYTERIEAQIERFAPGFRDVILARKVSSPADIETRNANMVGGDIGGGANDLRQFLFRPVARLDPYRTPNPKLFLCSSSTPPGGGVHGMCGYGAARSVLRRLRGASNLSE